jgi:glutamate N-acetyltransferase/amino-acid N-acetyltransferase
MIPGVQFATVEAGVRYSGRKDVMLAHLQAGASIAGMFTTSATRAASVLDCQVKLGGDPSGEAAIIVNSGNANAFTGSGGVEAVENVCAAVAGTLGIDSQRVFSSSTGVIGEALPFEKITAKLSDLKAGLSPGKLKGAAEAIMTTDTFPKASGTQIDINGKTVSITGIAKGSGMIAPDMATMLVYIFTDAKIGQPDLQQMVSTINDRTFNCITVDSDTSTSDTLIMAATGASGVDVTNSNDFEQALEVLMRDLAHQVVRDGEGATKFVTVNVTGANSESDAKRCALSIANSPLVKTAIAGEDPNWGRIVAAVGKSGAKADRDTLSISFDDICVAENGWVSPTYVEEQGAAVMREQDIIINVDLGVGASDATVWTCDLTHGYITINADYRS